MADLKNSVSPQYWDAIGQAKAEHGRGNFTGKFIRPHAKHIKGIIEQYKIKSLLDYGCGKGAQYSWTIDGKPLEEFWGIPVTKYDPCVEGFAAEPEGVFDLVICSHVLGAIPEHDIPLVVNRIYSLAGKYTYFVESIGGSKKSWASPDIKCPIGYTAVTWIELLAPVKPKHLRCELVVRYRTPSGSYSGRFAL